MNDITVSDLELMRDAYHYSSWLFEQVSRHVGRRVLEVGAGIGNCTRFLEHSELVVCVELHRQAADVLRQRYGNCEHILIVEGDICDRRMSALARHECDTAVCFNVLEHIEDEVSALRNIARILVPGARLLLIVPAVPALFGSVDRALGHHRRYLPSTLRPALQSVGYTVEEMRWVNLPGMFAWFLNSRIFGRVGQSRRQIRFFDRVVMPWVRRCERWFPMPIGLSLVAVGRTEDIRPSEPEDQVQQGVSPVATSQPNDGLPESPEITR